MPLSVKDGMGAWVKDFQDSNAPQFKGKSDKERREMAIAAYLSAKRGDRNEALLPTKDVEKVIGKGAKPIPKNAKNSDGTKTKPMSRASQLAKQARDSQPVDEIFAVKPSLTLINRRNAMNRMRKSPGAMTPPPKKDPNSPEARARMAAAKAREKSMQESTNLDEAHAYSKAANALRDYANKHGGMDKKDFHTAAKHLDNVGKAGIMQKGQHLAKMNAHFKGLDTDVRDRIHITLRQHGVMESVQEIFKSYSSTPGKRQIGRASDEFDMPSSNRVKLRGFGNQKSKGNMGDSTARASLKPKKPTKQDEETQIDELKKSTLGSYVKKAAQDAGAKAYSAAQKAMSNPDQSGKDYVKSVKRQKGIAKATDRLTREAKLDEVSAKKLTNYIGLSKDEKGNIQKTGAAGSLEKSLKKSTDAFRSGDKEARRAATKTANKRAKGLQMARAKLDKKVGAGSRAKVPATEAKSFDQKFRDHLKFFTSKSPAVQAYLQKRRDARAADHAKQDPKAVKQNYGPSVLVPGRAYNAATKRGMSPRDAADAVSTTFKNRRKRKNGKLPG